MTAVQIKITTAEYQEPAFGWYEIYGDQVNLALGAVVAGAAFNEISFANAFVHASLSVGDTWYYWVRPAYLDRTSGAVTYGALTALGSILLAGAGTAGDFFGPAVATDSHFVQFDTTTGKLGKDGGYSPASFDAAGAAAAALVTAEAYADTHDATTLATAEAYTDSKVAGLSWKQAVRAATAVAGTLASSFENGDTIDGVVLATGDRILIKNQAAPAENGFYVVAASGAPARSSDADSGSELVDASCYVSEGTANADTQWVCTTNAPIVLGVTSLSFAQLSSGAVPSAASTTEVLTGTDTAKYATPDAIAALWEQGADIASAGTLVVGEGGYFHVTGTTTITDIDPSTDKAGRKFWLEFTGILTLTNGAALLLPTGANITTAAGDTACFVSEGSDVVRCLSYVRVNGSALLETGSVATATLTPAYTTTTPTAPAAGDVLFARERAGYTRPAYIGISGIDRQLQDFLGTAEISILTAVPGAASASTLGCVASASFTAKTQTTTSQFTAYRRGNISNASGTNARSSGMFFNTPSFFRGTSSVIGGAFMSVRFGIETTLANGRAMVGFFAAWAGGNDPSTSATDCFAFGKDSGDSNWQIMHNDNAGNCTKVDLGANFPANSSAADMYQAELWIPPNGGTLYYWIKNLISGNETSGSVNSNLPTTTTAMYAGAAFGSGSTSGVHTGALCQIYTATGMP